MKVVIPTGRVREITDEGICGPGVEDEDRYPWQRYHLYKDIWGGIGVIISETCWPLSITRV